MKIFDPARYNDILIHAGDMTKGEHSIGNLRKVNGWFGSLPIKRDNIIIIAGNNDKPLDKSKGGKFDGHTIFTNAVYLQDQSYKLHGLKFYGSPYSSKHFGVFQLYGDAEKAVKWAKIPRDTDVLIVHGPPSGILDKTSKGKSVGDQKLLEEITKRVKPKVVVFGHIHHAHGLRTKNGIIYVNAAQNDAIYKGDTSVKIHTVVL